MGVHQSLLSIIPINRCQLECYKKMDEIVEAYGTETYETVKKMSMATGLSANEIVDKMHIFLSNYGTKAEDATKRMLEYLYQDKDNCNEGE